MSHEGDGAVPEEIPANPTGDVEMAEGGEGDKAQGNTQGNAGGSELPFPEAEIDPRTTFISYLMSPMVSLSIGPPEAPTLLAAHQALLKQSPYFAELCDNFIDDGSVSLEWQVSWE